MNLYLDDDCASRLLIRFLQQAGHDVDFLQLHNLVIQAGGHHPGILVIRKDNDPKRDLTERGIVQAVANLVQARRAPPQDEFHILNH